MTIHAAIRLLRKPEVLSLCGKSESALDRDVAAGYFPRPVRLSPDPKRRAVGWPLHEVEAVSRAIIAGESPEAIRKLVSDLIAARSALKAA